MGRQHSAYPCRAFPTALIDSNSHRLGETLSFQCVLGAPTLKSANSSTIRITAHGTSLCTLSPFPLQRNRRAVNISAQGGIQLLYRNASPA